MYWVHLLECDKYMQTLFVVAVLPIRQNVSGHGTASMSLERSASERVGVSGWSIMATRWRRPCYGMLSPTAATKPYSQEALLLSHEISPRLFGDLSALWRVSLCDTVPLREASERPLEVSAGNTKWKNRGRFGRVFFFFLSNLLRGWCVAAPLSYLYSGGNRQNVTVSNGLTFFCSE